MKNVVGKQYSLTWTGDLHEKNPKKAGPGKGGVRLEGNRSRGFKTHCGAERKNPLTIVNSNNNTGEEKGIVSQVSPTKRDKLIVLGTSERSKPAPRDLRANSGVNSPQRGGDVRE